MNKRTPADDFFDCKFQEYGGKKRYIVKHPDFPDTTVAAPAETPALVAAAEYRNRRWQDIAWYAYVNVTEKK